MHFSKGYSEKASLAKVPFDHTQDRLLQEAGIWGMILIIFQNDGSVTHSKPVGRILSYKFRISVLFSNSLFWTLSSTAFSFFLLYFQKCVSKLNLGNSRICQLRLDFIVPKQHFFILSEIKLTFMVMIRFILCKPRKTCHRKRVFWHWS